MYFALLMQSGEEALKVEKLTRQSVSQFSHAIKRVIFGHVYRSNLRN